MKIKTMVFYAWSYWATWSVNTEQHTLLYFNIVNNSITKVYIWQKLEISNLERVCFNIYLVACVWTVNNLHYIPISLVTCVASKLSIKPTNTTIDTLINNFIFLLSGVSICRQACFNQCKTLIYTVAASSDV